MKTILSEVKNGTPYVARSVAEITGVSHSISVSERMLVEADSHSSPQTHCAYWNEAKPPPVIWMISLPKTLAYEGCTVKGSPRRSGNTARLELTQHTTTKAASNAKRAMPVKHHHGRREGEEEGEERRKRTRERRLAEPEEVVLLLRRVRSDERREAPRIAQ